MPWVKVTDLVIHPRENDLVIGTYGRGLYIVNISSLQELTPAILAEDVHLFGIKASVERVVGAVGNYQLLGDSHLLTPNEPNAMSISYYLKSKPAGKVKIRVSTPYGEAVNEIEGNAEAGIHTAYWNMRPKVKGDRPPWMDEYGFGEPMVEPGEYVVALEIDGKTLTRKASITKRSGWSFGPFPSVIKEK